MSPDELAATMASALAPLDRVRVGYLFGSHATGRARQDSDLDVGVVYAPELDEEERERLRRELVALLTDALGALGERADIVDLDAASSAVAFRAISDGKRLFARTERERVAVEVRVARRYDDEAPRRALYRRAAVEAARRLGETPDD
jgi:predicted nucleotidyltransferase